MSQQQVNPLPIPRLPRLSLSFGWVVGAALAALLAVWLPSYLAMPFGRDQGMIGWVGQTIVHGGLPYRDAWDIKGPAAYFLYAAAIELFGTSQWAVRLFDVLMLAGAFAAATAIGRQAGSITGGIVATLILFLAYANGGYWQTAQPDEWAAFAALGVAALLAPAAVAETWAAAGAVGVLIGLATLVKPHYALLGLLPMLIHLGFARDRRRGWLLLFVSGAACLLVIGAALVPFALAGALPYLWEVHVDYVLRFYATRGGGAAEWMVDAVAALVGQPIDEPMIALVNLGALIGFVLLLPRNRRVAALLALGWVVGYATLVLQHRFWPYHFFLMLTFATVLTGYAVASLWEKAPAGPPFLDAGGIRALPQGRVVALCFLAVFLVATGKSMLGAARFWATAVGLQSREAYERQFVFTDFSYADTREVADYVKAHSRPDDPIFVWGFEALIYYLSDRLPPTRFGFDYPLLAGDPAYQQRLRGELMAALERRPPKFIIVEEEAQNSLLPKSSRASLEDFPELDDLIARNYRPAMRNGMYTVYAAASG